MPVKNFDELHQQHQNWKLDLLKTEKEIKALQDELTDLSPKASSTDQRIQVEHLQNALIRQKVVVNDKLQEITKIDKLMSEEGANSEALLKLDHLQQEDMEQFDRLFSELRKEFKTFRQSLG
ncbi:hypothetical protein MKQ70_14050 [Chitinophaga sedimenti]|uniref:hypothetical protein n=1 Tax=Chitinophaga sedimenti TaxID=2033606 RepID=UPI002004F2A3|nr:hypothetical protein [Chitinophaga sedimenti]MCK7556081.1 hypothetical protein [Chitinophaga sedimenti]